MKKILIIVCTVLITASFIQAQDIKNRSVYDQFQPGIIIRIKDSIKPDVYIDGVKYDHKIFSLLDTEKIKSMQFVTDEKELKKYDAKNGVILVTTKETGNDGNIRIRANGGEIEVDGKYEFKAIGNPVKITVFVIDGKVASQEELAKVIPNDVESIVVKNDEKTKEKYNAPNGVMVVKTKKKKE